MKLVTRTIEIIQNPSKTIIIRDRGIGMTEEEVLKYLNQIAFSSATEFLEKYQDSGIIGHFGLGFYSAFMVADKVEVVTKSWKEGAEAVRWTCAGDPSYSIEPGLKKPSAAPISSSTSTRKTKTFWTNINSKVCWKNTANSCPFHPVWHQEGILETGEGEEKKEESIEVPNIINETRPIWKKQPSDLQDADYQRILPPSYPMAAEPMFWIHLNIDYPFNLTGVLYFPKTVAMPWK
jgi:molecular chaperone HtpG